MKLKWLILGLLFSLVILAAGVGFKIKERQKITKKTEESTVKKCDHCNIMLMDIDILRADELPCYGYFRDTAPNICSFAKKSVIFKDNYSTAVWTLPSVFSTVTSLYPTFHRIRISYRDKLSDKIPTLAETLKKEGYYTVYVGYDLKNSALLSSENGGLKGYDLVTSEPIDKVISDISKEKKPWFIHYYNADLHLPYLIPEGEKPIDNNIPAPKNLPTTESGFNKLLDNYIRKNYTKVFNQKGIKEYSSIILSKKKSDDDMSVVNLFYKIKSTGMEIEYLKDGWNPIYDTYMSTFDAKNESEVAYVKMMYDTNLNILDRDLKAVLERLVSDEKTVTVIMSDHGESFGEHGTFSHSDDYHGELFYTPLIIHSPVLKEKIIEQTSSNIDIFPIILEAVNIPKIEGLMGKSLINNEDIGTSRFVFGESSEGFIIQNKDWLCFSPIDSPVSKSILYNKKLDPKEQKNVATEYPEVTQSLYNQIELLRSYELLLLGIKPTTVYSTPVNLEPEKIEKLKKEGYF